MAHETRPPDAYHTCYALTGLSTTQHRHYHTDTSASTKEQFASAYSWRYIPIASDVDDGADRSVFEEADRVKAFHPLYVIPHQSAENMRLWSEKRPL